MAQYQNPPLPSNLYTAGAVRFDNRQLNQMLYNEQKLQQAKAQKEAAVLDEEMKANVAKIRDADVPDFVNQYQQYATAKRRLMNDRHLRKDPQAYATAQMEVAKLYGGAMKLANISRQDREDQDFFRKDYSVHPENYEDDAASMWSMRNKIPYSRLNQVDLGEMDEKGQKKYRDWTSFDSFRYKGVDYDPTKLLNTAQGDVMKREVDEGVADKAGLQNKVTTYQFQGNSPMQYRDTILGGMLGDRKANKYFQFQLKNTPPEEIERINKEFSAIPESVWKQWGVNKQELNQSVPDNKSEAVANYLAKKYAIENLPKAIKTDLRTNEGVKLQMQNNAAMDRLRQSHQYRLNEIEARTTHTAGQVKSILNGEIEDLIAAAKATPHHVIKGMNKSGQTVEATKGYMIPMTMEISKAAMLPGEKEPPNAVQYVEKDGHKYIYATKYKPKWVLDPEAQKYFQQGYEKDASGNPLVDTETSKLIPLKQFRNALGRQLFTGKLLANEMGAEMPADEFDFEDATDDSGGGRPARATKPVKTTTGKAGISWQK